MDDAPAVRSPLSPLRAALGLTLCALAGASLAVELAPRVAPGLPLYEARASGIVVRGRDPVTLERALREAFAERVAARTTMAAARAGIRSTMARQFPPGPLPAQSSAAACGAELRGVALALESLASRAPADPSSVGEIPGELAVMRDAVAGAARAGDVNALDAFCLEEQARWAIWLRERVRDLPAERRAEIWPEWVARVKARALVLEAQAAPIESKLSPVQLSMVPWFAELRALAIEPRVPDPSRALLEFAAAPARVSVRPRPGARALVMLAGALLAVGLAVGLASALSVATGRGRVRAEAPALPATEPSRAAWLQVVTGRDSRRVARGAFELAARSLARGERVVLIEASPRLPLHRGLRLSSRLGWSECALDGLPALGVLQNGGFTGLFLLAYGRAGRIRAWLPLDRVLEELRPHFGRVVLALDDSAPAEVGSLLAGRVMDGWWAGPGPAGRGRAEVLEARLSILLRDMDLKVLPKATLEALERRLASLPPPPRRPATAPAAAPSSTSAAEPRVEAAGPAVLDCDLQLRQRLHFLAWMRRLKAQQRSRERESAASV